MYRVLLLGLACLVALGLAGRTPVDADDAPSPTLITNATQVMIWADAHAGAFGMDPLTLAQPLLASGFYESGLQDVANLSHSGALGPFQFYGPTLATAQAEGFNVHSIAGSLDAFTASGDLGLGIQAYAAAQAQGADTSSAMHAFYLAMERPGAAEDAVRYARGDWDASYAFAVSVGAGSGDPGAIPANLATSLGTLANAANRAAVLANPAQTHWPSGAVGPPGKFVGDTMTASDGTTYMWDGSTWVPAPNSRPRTPATPNPSS